MKLNRRDRLAWASKASDRGRFFVLVPYALRDRTLDDGSVVRELAEQDHQYVVKALRDVFPVSVSRYTSKGRAEAIEQVLTKQLGRDVTVVTDNVVMLRAVEVDSKDVAALIPKMEPSTTPRAMPAPEKVTP